MRLLAVENIALQYGDKPLLTDVTLQINQGDKIGLIGVNGTGKSTLLKILAGKEVPERGSVFVQPGTRVVYLPQNPVFTPGATVIEQVMRQADSRALEGEYKAKSLLTRLGVVDFEEKGGSSFRRTEKTIGLGGGLGIAQRCVDFGRTDQSSGL